MPAAIITPDALRKQLRLRQHGWRYGVKAADGFFSSIQNCFAGCEGGFCPTKLFAQADEAKWAKELEAAAEKFTYCDPKMIVKAASRVEQGKGSILDFDAIITSTRKDRDTDVLESIGAELDPAAPLLWQHTPFNPIGVVKAGTFKKSKSNAFASFSILDTELGRDAAVLVEGGALRISHGFDPQEYEPLEKGGWHFLKFLIYEVSLVSVPSNTDAIITEFSRHKLHSPLIKGWAQKLFEGRPVQGKGFSETPQGQAACSCHKNKAAEPKTNKGYGLGPVMNYPQFLDGSWEAIELALQQKLAPYLVSKMLCSSRADCLVLGTFGDSAIVCCNTYEYEYKSTCYRIAWSMNGDAPEWTGDPETVDIQITAEVVAKMAKDFKAGFTKAGRKISSKNCGRIKSAMGHLDHMCGMDDTPKPQKSMCKEAKGWLKEAMDDQGEEEAKSAAVPETKALESVGDVGARWLLGLN